MPRVTLDRETFKALASDTRLDILRVLDGKKMSLKDISKETNLNKATLHEHLSRLSDAGLVKRKEREGHKWVYYKLTWKGESLLHPENTRIVVLFSATFFALFFGIIQLLNFAKGKIVGLATTYMGSDSTQLYAVHEEMTYGVVSNSALEHIADVPTQNQTIALLSRVLNQNATIKGFAGNTVPDEAIQWTAYDAGKDAVNLMLPAADEATRSAPTMVAFIQDPALLYIALGCFIIFMVLILIAIWRLWENKTPKL